MARAVRRRVWLAAESEVFSRSVYLSSGGLRLTSVHSTQSGQMEGPSPASGGEPSAPQREQPADDLR